MSWPHERQEVSWFRRHLAPHENWYRDFWLVIVTAVVAWGLALGQDTAGKARDAADKARAATGALQQERIDAVWGGCEAQDSRHDNTIRQLRAEIRYYERHHLEAPMQTKAQIAANVKGTIALINALAPRVDCNKLVFAAVGRTVAATLVVRRGLPPRLR